MFSRIVPPNSHVSWSTMPMFERRSRRRIFEMSRPSRRDRAAVDLVEAHDQVHERGLARAGRADDRDRLARLGDERQVLDERVLRVVGERDVVELDAALRVEVLERHERRPRSPPRASSSSKTRSAEAIPDCITLIIDASWVSGCVNWREYWMNAWMSPIAQLARRHPQPADERDRDVVQVAEEHHRGLDRPGDELRAVARLEQLLVLVVELLLDVASGGRTPSRASGR